MPKRTGSGARVWAATAILLFMSLLIGCAGQQGLSSTAAQDAAIEASLLARDTAEGVVLGQVDEAGDTLVWKGIPYARPPVEALRWRAPQSPERRAEPLVADEFCQLCPQYIDHDRNPATPQVIVGGEDCLYLNIWSPAQSDGPLPVFFWIHGGGNSIQWPLLSRQTGGFLADRGNMVVVTASYRLGPMGFWHHPALKTGDPAEDSGNFATLDLIQALKWVRTNIAHFGGDPDNVTIAGESAGGQNVFSLLVSPLAQGLFHRAISQSGVVRHFSPTQGTAHVDTVLAKRLVHEGKAADAAAAKEMLAGMSLSAVADWMRAMAPQAFLEMYPEGKAAGMLRLPTCFIDGHVLPTGFYDAWAAGAYNKVPLIVGTNKEETKLFLRLVPPFGQWRQDYSLFTDPVKEALYQSVAEYQSDGWRVMAVDEVARLLSDPSGQPDLFAYHFLWGAGAGNTVIASPLNLLLGACHAMEIDFVFGTENASLGALVFTARNRAGRIALSNAMMDYWSAFAHAGNPNPEETRLPAWLPWSNAQDGPKVMLLDADLETAHIRMSSEEMSNATIEAALQAEPRRDDIQPFWDASPFRMR
ncbi:carboxylesterase/lipase family protein [Desulfatitalea alkaliphila]|uniref:Carboxylic ester hydrolase n=1 Tax=Desulfatitalea alkaliphila TaxID=2929485 RepID=A0AA41UIQ1_9BACT|nr:carboxylesterase family protein [Desulfatitalea alkaliphila]MCJ8500339.1 carboxylesterase family protein [Desulfatitalea alkaliphila]